MIARTLFAEVLQRVMSKRRFRLWQALATITKEILEFLVARLLAIPARLFPHDIDGYINHKSPVTEKIYKEFGIDKK